MTIRAHLDDQFDRQFGGLPNIAPPVSPRCPYCDDTGDIHSLDGEWRGECTYCAPPVAPGLVVTEIHMDGLLLGNSDFEINNPHAVGVLPYDPMTQHEAENGICVEGESNER